MDMANDYTLTINEGDVDETWLIKVDADQETIVINDEDNDEDNEIVVSFDALTKDLVNQLVSLRPDSKFGEELWGKLEREVTVLITGTNLVEEDSNLDNDSVAGSEESDMTNDSESSVDNSSSQSMAGSESFAGWDETFFDSDNVLERSVVPMDNSSISEDAVASALKTLGLPERERPYTHKDIMKAYKEQLSNHKLTGVTSQDKEKAKQELDKARIVLEALSDAQEKAATKLQAVLRSKQARNQIESQKHMDLTSRDMREIGKAKVFEGKMAKLGEEIGKLNPGVKGSYYEQTKHVASLIVQRPFAKKYSDIFKQNESIQAKIKEALKTDYIVVDFTDPKGEKTKIVKFENLAAHMRDHAAHLKSKNPLWESSTTQETGNLSEIIPELEKSAKKYQKWIDTAKDPRSSTAKIVDRTISVARMATLVGAVAAFAEFGPVAQTIALGQAGVAGAAAVGKAGVAGAAALGKAGVAGAAALGKAGVAGAASLGAAGVAGGASLIAAGVAGGALSILALTGYGAAAIGVIALGVWLYKRNEAAVDKFFSDSKVAIGNKASAAWEGTKNFFRPAITAMGDAASWAQEMIKSKYQHEMLHHSMYKPNIEAQLKLSEQELNDLKAAIVRANVAVYASDPEGERITMTPLTLLDNDHPSEEAMEKGGEQLREGHGLYFDHQSYSSSEGVDTKYPALHGIGELDFDQANPRTLHGMVLLAEDLREAENGLEDVLIKIGESKESSLSQAEYDAIKTLLKSVRRQKILLDTSISVEKAKQSKEEWKAFMASAKDAVFGVKLDEAKTRLNAAQEKLASLKLDLEDVSEGKGYEFIEKEIVAADTLVEQLQTQYNHVLAKQEEMTARLEAKANAPSRLESVKAYFSRDDAKRRSTANSVGRQDGPIIDDELNPLVSRGGPLIDDTDDNLLEITEDGLIYDEDESKGVMGRLKSAVHHVGSSITNAYKNRLHDEVVSQNPDQPEESLGNQLKKAQDELEKAQDAVDNPREGVDLEAAKALVEAADQKVADLINEISSGNRPPSQ
jgi:tRNA nucleotidyltransferase/poly(A) polymerase